MQAGAASDSLEDSVQPFLTSQPSDSLGIIGWRSVSDLGAIGDSIGGTAYSDEGHDHGHIMRMLEAGFHRHSQLKYSERAKISTLVLHVDIFVLTKIL